MPTSKSSILTEDDYSQLLKEKATEGDHLYLLIELLSVIHRDGGQFTLLAGLATSVEEAMAEVRKLHRKPRVIRPSDDR